MNYFISAEDRFLKKYKKPLLFLILKDNDFDVKIFSDYYNFQETKENSKTLSNDNIAYSAKEYSIRRNGFKWKNSDEISEFPNKDLYTEEDVNFLYNHCNNFSSFSSSTDIEWSFNLIEKFKNEWNWAALSKNNSIQWNFEQLKRFEKYIDFRALSYNIGAKFCDKILIHFNRVLDWNGISGNPKVAEYCEWFLHHDKNVIRLSEYTRLTRFENILKIRDCYEGGVQFHSDILPSLSTNPQIHWNIAKLNRGRVDLWSILLSTSVSDDIIDNFGNQFNENRFFRTVYTKWSDWYDDYPVYRNGWQSYLLNRKEPIDILTFKKLSLQKIDLITSIGSPSRGYHGVNEKSIVSNLVTADKLDIKFEDMLLHENLFEHSFLSETKIDDVFFKKIIKPFLLENKSAVEYVCSV